MKRGHLILPALWLCASAALAQPGHGPISGGGGGGLPGANEVTESMLKAVDAAADEECLTYESTVGDFEWQSCGPTNYAASVSPAGPATTATALAANGANCSAGSYPLGVDASGAAEGCTAAATGTIGGTLGATDNVAVCTDGTGGVTAGACTGQAFFPDGTQTAPGIGFTSDTDVGFYRSAANTIVAVAGNTQLAQFDLNAFYPYRGVVGAGDRVVTGFKAQVTASTAGSGAPKVLVNYDLGATWTNEGTTAEAYFTLPTAVAGYQVEFCVQDSDGLRVTASAGDTIRRGSSVTATAGYIVSTTIGSCVTLLAINATEWFVAHQNDISADSWTFN